MKTRKVIARRHPVEGRRLIDVEHYDRDPTLSAVEKAELSYLITRHSGAAAGPWKERSRVGLKRLTEPLHDACDLMQIDAHRRCHATRVLMHEMHRRGISFWAWNNEEWVETIGPTMPAFVQRHGGNVQTVRQPIFGIAYLLARFTAFDLFSMHSVELTTLAMTVFGQEAMTSTLSRIMRVLLDWGYKPSVQGKVHTALAYAFLTQRSPRLEDLTFELLQSLFQKQQTKYSLAHLYPLSRALAHLKIICAPLPSHRQSRPLLERIDTVGVAAEWVAWCFAWHERSTLTKGIKKQTLYTLLQIGRWLAQAHPQMTSPEQWDYDLAADFVAAVDQLKVGDWRSPRAGQLSVQDAGKPLMPRTKASFLCTARIFFAQLQDIPHRVSGAAEAHTIPRRFNPLRALRTPPSIKNLIGPDPRVIDDKFWLKIIHATETLEPSDLRRFQLAMYPFELVRAVAVTWCLSGLRGDEIRRLRVGCVRSQVEDGMRAQAGQALPDDGLCFLSIPVNKTGTAFTKPVHWLIGKRIAEWERLRPPQASALDAKTNEKVDFLFSYRGIRIGPAYINLRLIPLICAKANIPEFDARGKITAHRARATLATALYNAPEGLTIGELGEWLGHKDLRSTQHYAKLQPTRLAKSVARASKNSRLAQVLVDPVAASRGEPAIFYYLGDGNYCANPAWATCAHRMACLKCPMYVAKNVAQLIEARDGVLHLMQEVPLSNEERDVVEGDVKALNRYIEKRKDVSPPPVPDERYVFNPAPQKDHVVRSVSDGNTSNLLHSDST